MPAASTRQPNFAILVALAWLLVALQMVLQFWAATGTTLNGPDDAMRLYEMRGLLAGHGWFGMYEARVQPPLGYYPHWSRLIDAGLAGLYLLFKPFVGAAMAQRLMRVIWPMLWLIPAISAVAAIAWRMAGRSAALAALLLAVIGLPAYQQFVPGRIDHHNVQIAIVLMTLAATVWTGQWRWSGVAAGGLTGLGFAIGYEGAPLLVLCGVALALRYIVNPNSGRDLRAYGFAVAASTAVAFLVSVPPSRWLISECDAIAFNTAVPTVIGGLGLAAASFWRGSLRSRYAGIAITAAVAVAAFVFAEPRCLGGPYAMVDPRVKSIWLDHVGEMQPLLVDFADMPVTALWTTIFPAASVVAIIVLTLRTELRRNFAFLVAASSLLLAFALMFVAIKVYSYAMWLGMPLVAVLALDLCAAFKFNTLLARFVVVMLLTPKLLSAGAIRLANAAGINETQSINRQEQKACFATASYAPLAKLPPGLIVAEINYGPYLLALTPLSVMAAPYHRLSFGILTDYEALASPPPEARRILRKVHARYVATCGPLPFNGPTRATSLLNQLKAGHVPDWLEPKPMHGSPFAVYRIKP